MPTSEIERQRTHATRSLVITALVGVGVLTAGCYGPGGDWHDGPGGTTTTSTTGVVVVPQPDTDVDGIVNRDDNCPFVANGDQVNSDTDGAGDACDPDPLDGDAVLPDTDADGFPDHIDGCPTISGNGAGTDADNDGIPDACDPDYIPGT